jgi:hypothetical protein
LCEGSSINFADIPLCPNCFTEVARYHSHPIGGAVFSPADRDNSGSEVPFAVGSHDGESLIIPEDIELVPGKIIKIPHGEMRDRDRLRPHRWTGWGIDDYGNLHPKDVVPDQNNNKVPIYINPK